jgi:hypothetical protein
MNMFTDAGKRFLADYERYGEARDKAIGELESIRQFCEMGVMFFYKAITDGGRPDVYVARKQENLVTIEFGPRPCGFDTVRTGPMAAVLVTPDGSLVLAAGSGWMQDGDLQMKSRTIGAEHWDMEIANWLIEFIEDSEGEYRKLHH